VLGGEAANTNFIVLGLTPPALKPKLEASMLTISAPKQSKIMCDLIFFK